MRLGAPRKPVAWVLALLVVAVALAVWRVEIRADAESVFVEPADGLRLSELESARLAVAVIADDSATRIALAREIAGALESDPLVAEASLGPAPPPSEALSWLWRNRFRLSPPDTSAFEVEAMAERLQAARASLTTAEGMAFGDYMLRDPTGAFASLIARVQALAPPLPHEGGVWRSRDGGAALIFARLRDGPIEKGALPALAERVRAMAQAKGAQALLIGPKLIAAEIGAAIERDSLEVCSVAVLLLIGWMIWIFRSPGGAGAVLLPLAVAAPVAALVVDAAFGSIHAIAIGFGGALTGLALDYPLHFAGHGRAGLAKASRGVLIGALTTAVAFLAMLGAGVPALAEVGLFVATGLMVAAGLSRLLASGGATVTSAPGFEALYWRLPRRRGVEAAAVALGLAAAFIAAQRGQEALADAPEAVKQTIQAFAEMTESPSGRYLIAIDGADGQQALARERSALPVLDAAIANGEVGRSQALGAILPDLAAQESATAATPSPQDFEALAREALTKVGMAPGYASQLSKDYAEARKADPIAPADLARMPVFSALLGQLRDDASGGRSILRLYDVAQPEALARRIQDAGLAGVRFVDVKELVQGRLSELRRATLLWLGVGAAGALLALLWLAPSRAAALGIAWTTAAAMGTTVAALTLLGADFDIFQIVALTLVAGIGVDYAVFLQLSSDRDERVAAARSVGLCVVSTMIAFLCMAFASSRILHEIGLTVSIGLAVMVLHNFATAPGREITLSR